MNLKSYFSKKSHHTNRDTPYTYIPNMINKTIIYVKNIIPSNQENKCLPSTFYFFF